MAVDADSDPGPPPAGDLEVRLADEQIDEFHRDGFTLVDRITTDEELAWLRPIYDQLFGERRGTFKGGYFDLARPYEAGGQDLVPQVLAPELQYPQLRDTTLYRNAQAIAAQLLAVDEAEVAGWGHMILKPAEVGGELPWHQDEAYWEEGFSYRAVGCWLPLDGADLGNGCLQFVPGSHLGHVREHRHIGDDPNIHGLVTDEVDDADGVPVPVPAGGATFHACRTLHRSMPNTTDRPRRAYANEFQVPPVPLEPGEVPNRPWVQQYRDAWAARDVYRDR